MSKASGVGSRETEHMGLSGLKLHPLKGIRKDTWAVWVSENWRITPNQQGTFMRFAIYFSLLALSSLSLAADLPYEERADAKADIAAALAHAKRSKVTVLVVFGANWCADCRILDTAFKSAPSAALIDKNFKVVKVDVGRFDKNVDIADLYGIPLRRGIPAVAILAADGRVTYSTRGGELADARKMGERGIHDFFVKVAPASK